MQMGKRPRIHHGHPTDYQHRVMEVAEILSPPRKSHVLTAYNRGTIHPGTIPLLWKLILEFPLDTQEAPRHRAISSHFPHPVIYSDNLITLTNPPPRHT